MRPYGSHRRVGVGGGRPFPPPSSAYSGRGRLLQSSVTSTLRLRLGERALVPFWELPAVLLLIIYYFVSEDPVSPQSYELANLVGPALLTAILAVSAAISAVVNNANLWTGLLWFRFSTALYFGFGSLVPFIVNDATRLYLEIFYPARADEMFRVNLLVAICTLVTLATARLTLILQKPLAEPETRKEGTLISTGIAFAIAGYSVKFLVTIPLLLGYFDNAVVWGTLLTVGSFGPIGIYLIARHGVLHGHAWLVVSFVLMLADIFIGVLLFSKTQAMYGAIFFVLGLLSGRVTFSRALLSAGVVSVLFGVIVPLSDYGRVEAPRLHGASGGTLAQRFEVLSSFYDGGAASAAAEEVQNTYGRLSYMHAAAFAMNRYDIGLPGHSLVHAWAAPIPRFLWPEKPNMTEIGQDFNELALNFRTSGAAPGIFADAYWNFGWCGVPIVFLPLGVAFALMSRYALRLQAQERWLLFPVILIIVRIGFRVDGFIVTDLWGPLFIVIAFHYVLVVGEFFWNRRLARSSGFR